jgi:hypothetical protein
MVGAPRDEKRPVRTASAIICRSRLHQTINGCQTHQHPLTAEEAMIYRYDNADIIHRI